MEGAKCALCGKEASQTCAHCAQISYCGREHEKQHWAIHKTTCRPFKIEHNDVLGRYMVASRDIKPGELILKESPLIVGPRVDSVPICLVCYHQFIGPPSLCVKCHQAPICSEECESKPDHTDYECEMMSKISHECPDWSLCSSLQLVMPLRLLRFQEHAKDVWDEVIKLESHLKERESSPVWKHHQLNVVEVLQKANIISSNDEAVLVHKLCGIIDVNSFELRGPNPALMTHGGRQGERLRGIYLQAALMAHDCIGNTHLAVNDEYLMSIHASVPIQAGEPIYFNYTSALESTLERQEHLKIGKYFDCTCRRCSDPTELGTYMGSIKCPRCHTGQVIKPGTKDETWHCEHCKHPFHSRLIKTTMSRAWTEVEDADNTDDKALENLLKKFSRSFPTQSAVVLEIKQNLVALYRDAILREMNPSRKLLQRKTELCLELLTVLNVIEPGISRLKGITMYELHIPMVLLANKLYDSGEINSKELLVRLQDAEIHLKNAVSILLYEPTNSPEGQLLKVALDELRILRDHIQEARLLNETEKKTNRRKNNYGRKTKK